MAAVGLVSANHVNGNTAGMTNVAVQPRVEHATAVAHQAETRIAETGGALTHLLGGGVHPEHVVAHASTDLERASNSVETALGGLRPKAGSVLTPGPAGRAAAAYHHLGL